MPMMCVRELMHTRAGLRAVDARSKIVTRAEGAAMAIGASSSMPEPASRPTPAPAWCRDQVRSGRSSSRRCRDGLPSVGLGLEPPGEEPEGQRELKEYAGDGEIVADVDPEDFGDLSSQEKRV